MGQAVRAHSVASAMVPHRHRLFDVSDRGVAHRNMDDAAVVDTADQRQIGPRNRQSAGTCPGVFHGFLLALFKHRRARAALIPINIRSGRSPEIEARRILISGLGRDDYSALAGGSERKRHVHITGAPLSISLVRCM